MNFKDLKIGTRLWIAFSFLILMMMVIFLVSYFSLSSLNKKMDNIGQNRIPDMIDFSEMNGERMSIRSQTLEIFKCSQEANCRDLAAKVFEKRTNSWKIIDEHWDKIQKRERMSEKGRQLMKELVIEYKAWRDVYIKLDDLILKLKNFKTEEEKAILMGEYNSLYLEMVPISDKMGKTFKEALSNNMNNTNTMISQTADSSENAKTGMMVTILIALTFTGFVSFLIIGSIIKPLKKGVAFAESLSNGKLNIYLEIQQKDEIGELAHSLQNMANKLKEILTQVIEGAEHIASASHQMNATSQQLSEGASDQASSTEQVSSSMEEMTSNIEQNTDNALQTEKISIRTMEEVNNVGNASGDSLTSIQDIAQKITIINDIAFQTNILALNAAVEAARAGEYGKGFAVVAAEVRKLAERSKIAADEISILSKSSVDVTEKTRKQIQEIIPEFQKTTKLVQEIASASQEQREGANQVNNAIQQLNTVTQHNAAAAEELASSSQELSNQAEQLKVVVSYFKIDK